MSLQLFLGLRLSEWTRGIGCFGKSFFLSSQVSRTQVFSLSKFGGQDGFVVCVWICPLWGKMTISIFSRAQTFNPTTSSGSSELQCCRVTSLHSDQDLSHLPQWKRSPAKHHPQQSSISGDSWLLLAGTKTYCFWSQTSRRIYQNDTCKYSCAVG